MGNEDICYGEREEGTEGNIEGRRKDWRGIVREGRMEGKRGREELWERRARRESEGKQLCVLWHKYQYK